MSTVAKKLIMGSGGGPEEWALEQSLIFNKASSSKLERTPSSGGNRRTFTISTWFKIGEAAVSNYGYYLFGAHVNGQNNDNSFFSVIFYNGDLRVSGWNQNWLRTNRVFRDHSAWYHVVVAVDTTSGTANNRVRIYINGVEETSFAVRNNPSQNFDFPVNRVSYPQTVGSVSYSNAKYWDGYMAEYHLIDGTALTPSSFGETNSATGQWIPKEYEGGSYGTNGFYLKFKSGAIGTDSSGQGNNYTASNLANSDVVIDTPLNNFCTLNPLDNALPALLEGNTNTGTAGANSWKMARSTFELTTGKWYWEMKWTGNTVNSTNGYQMGLKTAASTLTAAAQQAGSYAFQGTEIFLTAGSLNTVTISPGSATTGQNDIIMFAYDADAGKMWIGVNGTWTSSGNPAAGSNNQWASIPTTGVSPFAGVYGSNISIDCNFGQKTYAYTPPSGFNALSTANLPDPAIPLPSAHFNTVLYTGNGGTQSISGVGHQPGLTWIKNRSAADWHSMTDSNRGVQKTLFPNYGNNSDGTDTGPISGYEATYNNGLTAFNSDGFTVGSKNEFNTNNENFVSWNWKAGSNASNSGGQITTTVSANQTAGFSIITYAGEGTPDSTANKTIGHGLSAAPTFVIIKKRSGGSGATAGPAKGGSWATTASAVDPNWYGGFYLNYNSAYYNANGSGTNYFWNGAPTSSVINLKKDWFVNGSSSDLVAYAWHEVAGFSKFGTYTGNGNADGPFIFTGFKPAWLLYKITSTTVANGGDWGIRDLKRDPANVSNTALYANLVNAEGTTSITFDILSNGFKARSTNSDSNQSGQTFLYIAFAESPFKTSNAH